jgi:ribose/xylose/arabinose/galactoside ABC-type transport system permease subunit
MSLERNRLTHAVLNNTPLLLFALMFIIFGLVAPQSLRYQSLENAVNQASYVGIIAVGMTFVLLTGGIDLSVGSNMYVSARVDLYLHPLIAASFIFIAVLIDSLRNTYLAKLSRRNIRVEE